MRGTDNNREPLGTVGAMEYILPDKTMIYRTGDFFFETDDVSHLVNNKSSEPNTHLHWCGKLEGLKQVLQVQLKQTSWNSSRPPSSAPPSHPRPHRLRHQSPTTPRLGTPKQRQRPKPMRSSPSSCAHPLYYGRQRETSWRPFKQQHA